MSANNFMAYEKHIGHREVLGQHKSVLLKDCQALRLVCQELGLENVYDDLEYAARHGHILVRSRFFLQDKQPEIRSGILSVINKSNLNLLKLFAHNHRTPETREFEKLHEVIDNVFAEDLLVYA